MRGGGTLLSLFRGLSGWFKPIGQEKDLRVSTDKTVSKILPCEEVTTIYSAVGQRCYADKKTAQKAAFTLAEVLITLGIIGVVAALTLPTLISNYQKKAWTTALLKTRTVLEEGFRRAMSEQDTADYEYLGCHSHDSAIFKNCMKKYFNAREVSLSNYAMYPMKNDFGNDSEIPQTSALVLADGVLVFCEGTGPVGDFILVDVNGQTKPNTFGRDIFLFVIGTSRRGSNLAHPIGFGTLSDVNEEYIDSAVSAGCAYVYGNCNGRMSGDYNVTDEALALNDDISRAFPGVGYTPKVLREGKMDY